MSEFTSRKQMAARRAYVCNLCGCTIVKGSEYIKHAGKYRGTFFETKLHIHCDAVFDAYTSVPQHENELDPAEIERWVYEKECRHCVHCDRVEGCERDTFCCQRAIKAVTDASRHWAIEASLRANRMKGERR